MYICYIDESGTPEIPGTSSHFILAGLAIPVELWRQSDESITKLLVPYGLENEELHTAWMARRYIEQSKIVDFESLTYKDRRHQVQSLRTKELLRLQKSGNSRQLRQTKKNYAKTSAYIHLTHDERMRVLTQTAGKLSSWGRVRLFAECIDKTHFDPTWAGKSAEEQAFEQVISRFQT
jgi:hypothetical protein